jgi:hypothetical protein
MTAKFEIIRDGPETFRLRLKSSSGETIAISESCRWRGVGNGSATRAGSEATLVDLSD